MSIILQPVGDPAGGWPLVVTADEPWSNLSTVVLRGVGGGTQVVYSAMAPEAGQTVTHRASPADVPALWAALHTPTRWELIDNGCPVMAAGSLVVTAVALAYTYEVAPAVAVFTITLAAA